MLDRSSILMLSFARDSILLSFRGGPAREPSTREKPYYRGGEQIEDAREAAPAISSRGTQGHS